MNDNTREPRWSGRRPITFRYTEPGMTMLYQAALHAMDFHMWDLELIGVIDS